MTSARILLVESRMGALRHEQNFDRCLALPRPPLLAVVDSECSDATVANVVIEALLTAAPDIERAASQGVEAVRAQLLQALTTAHSRIRAIPRALPGYAGGAAVTLCAGAGTSFVVAHIGDCRLYAREQGAWVQKTTDHTLRQATRDAPEPLLQEMDTSWQASIITNALGISEQLQVDSFELPLAGVSAVLLCTRGAWMPSDPEGDGSLSVSLGEPTDAAEVAAARLFTQREADGNRDDATIVLAVPLVE